MKNRIPSIIITGLIILICSEFAHSQSNVNTISTAASFININPNAQSRSFGEIGVVTPSIYYELGLTQNPALLITSEKIYAIKFSYTPWLRNLFTGFNLYDIATTFSINSKNSLAFSYNHFSHSNIQLTTISGNPIKYQPKEVYLNLKYARAINNNTSVGMGVKYIYSDIAPYYLLYIPGISFALDLGLHYKNEFLTRYTDKLKYSIGFSVLNIGNKINYSNNSKKEFIPTTLITGLLLSYQTKQNDKLHINFDIAYQIQKLLVPTPPIYYNDSLDYDGLPVVQYGKDPNVSVAKGIVQSFYDAPNGFSEEINEIIHQFGFENRYTIKKDFRLAIRLGYFNEHYTKGNRKYFTSGIGLFYKFVYLDFAIIKTSEPKTALNNTWSLNIGFKFTL